MSRRNKKEKIKKRSNARKNISLVSKLINIVMLRGKKSLAERIVYKAIERANEVLKSNEADLLLVVLSNTRTEFEIKSRRIGGATYQVPIDIGYERQESLVLHRLVKLARLRKGITISNALALEIIDGYRATGSLVKKKEEINKLAKTNRSLAHLRW